MPADQLKQNKHGENAILTILSAQHTDGDTDKSELNTTALFTYQDDEVRIEYTELDEAGKPIGQTIITVLNEKLVTIHKIGFAEGVMILETGKTHPVKYSTMFGHIEMLLCTLDIQAAFQPNGGRLQLRYLLDIGNSYSATNTIDLHVRLR